MKRAKIMLSAIAVIAIVSGAVAFKASHNTNKFFYFGTTLQGGNTIKGCVLPVQLPFTTTAVGGSIITPYSSSLLITTSSVYCTVRVTPAQAE